MENKSSIWELCMVFGVVAIVLAGFMGAVSASDDQKSAIAWSQSEGSNTKIDSLLVQKMEETPSGEIPVIIEMKEQHKAPFNVQEAKSLAIKSQKPLTASLENIQAGDIREYWIINAVSATVPVQKIDEIAARPDVKNVWLDKEIRLIEPVDDIGDDMMINPLLNDSGDSSDRMIQVSTVNYTPPSLVDEVVASDYIRLYLRPDPTGPPYEDYLSESPETSTYVTITMPDDGDSYTWGDYDLDGDITATDYGYWIYFASASSTIFEIKIIIDGETVATFPHLTVPYDEYFLPFSDMVTGLDPTTSAGDEVVLEITKISGGDGRIIFGAGAPSNIEISPIIPPDYGDDIINAPQMGDRGYDGSGVKISILDSGIDDTHPDLEGRVIAENDFTDDGTTDDLDGHGTHCAGIAAGSYNAGAKVTGVASGASLMNAKVLNQSGVGFTSWIMSGIEWSIGQNADVLSMSLGGFQGDGSGRDLESMLITNTVNAGKVFVIAAGNSGPGEGTIGSPAVAYGAIAVAASDSNDTICDFSSRGPCGDGRVGIDIAAPGYKIIAPNAFWERQNDHIAFSGTSMSCPHVAGAAALLLQANPNLTPEEVERALKNGADVIDVDKADQSRIVYYAFDVDDIDNITIQWQLINNSENWLRVAGMSTGSVLVIDDENYLGSDDNQSVGRFRSVFEDIGYTVTVEESDKTSYSTWGNYDIVVWSCGDDPTPIYDPAYKRMLIDYVTDGGHLLLESGYIASWINQHGDQVIDRELREKVLHAIKGWAYSDVGDLTFSTQHPIATTPNVLPKTINFSPTNPGDKSGDANAVRILPDAVGVYNWSSVAYGGSPISESVASISYSLIAYNDTGGTVDGYDVWEQGAGRLDVNDAYNALTNGILVDPQWFVGIVRSGSYTKTFTVVNNGVNEKTVSITRSTGDAGDWITLPTSVTVPAGGTANFDAIMNVPGDAVGAYKGSIRVNDGIEDIIIPVSVNVVWDNTKTGPITGSVDEGGDWVYYTLDVPHTTDLNISLDWTNSNNDLDLCLFSPNGTLTNVSWYDKPEMITVDNPSAGYWTVAINAYTLETAQETYTLEITTLTLRGDVNHDGVVTSADAVIVLEMAVRGEYSADADVNRDYKVTSLDALMILQVVAGAITL